MRLFILIAIFFYVLVISIVGVTGMLLLAHLIDVKAYLNFLNFVYKDPQAGMIAGCVLALTVLISLAFARIIYGRQENERNIFINNPLGRVTISVSALEDLIRRMAVRHPQIKEIRPDITSMKKALHIDIKLVLRSEVNIPELTAELQDRIRRKIQDTIGNEERVNIRIHVIKIATDLMKSGRGSSRDYDDEDTGDVMVPFPGYKA